MNSECSDRATIFSRLNGRDVFESATVKRWLCPVCKWWRDWNLDRCCGCGLRRDRPVPQVRHATGI